MFPILLQKKKKKKENSPTDCRNCKEYIEVSRVVISKCQKWWDYE